MVVGSADIGAWAERIKASLARTVEAFIDTGQLLIDCKVAVGHGQFQEAVRRAGMSPQTARMFMSVAQHPVVGNVGNASLLPGGDYTALSLLASVEPKQLLAAMKRGAVRSDMSRAEVKAFVGRSRVKLVNPSVPEGTFATIAIDPPWPYENQASRGAANNHYPPLTLDELADLEIPAARNAHLYLWVTNAFLGPGLELLDAWGFTYRNVLTWCKPHIGPGNYFRNSTEQVLFATRGKLALRRNDVGTWFKANRGKRHSTKPEEFYQLVERCSPGPYLDMFARRQRAGWSVFGNEV